MTTTRNVVIRAGTVPQRRYDCAGFQHAAESKSIRLRIKHTRNNPLKYIDPSGHKECEKASEGGICESATNWERDDAVARANLCAYNSEYCRYKTKEAGEALELIGSLLFEPVDWILTARDCINGDCSGALLGALPFVSGATRKMFGVADDLGDAGRAVNRADDALDSVGDATRKKVPNPNGRRGSPQHQSVMDDIIGNAPSGTEVASEFHVPTPGRKKSNRYIDVAYLDANGDPTQFFQVGRMNKNGMPVAREVDAASDILQFGPYDLPIDFVPYN